MNTLSISLFGCPYIAYTKRLTPIQVSTNNLAILAYLLLHRDRFCSRDILIDQFWNEHPEKSARKCLNTALWRLRTTLERADRHHSAYILSTDMGEVGFNWKSNYWLDVEVFEHQTASLLSLPVAEISAENIHTIEKSIQLYQGDFLEGFYDHWVLQERERLRRIYLNGLTYLMHYYDHHEQLDTSIQYGQQILELEPLYEHVHREVMRLYMQNGQRTLALQQYETCQKWLAKELDVPPMEETEALYQQLTIQDQPKQSKSIQISRTMLHQEVLRELQLAHHQLNEAQDRMTRLTQLIEKM